MEINLRSDLHCLGLIRLLRQTIDMVKKFEERVGCFSRRIYGEGDIVLKTSDGHFLCVM